MKRPVSRTLGSLISEIATSYPSHPFLIDGERRWSYAQFRKDVGSLAKGLYQIGIRPNDKVGVLMGNQAEWVLTIFAATSLGAVAVCMNTWWKSRELRYALATADVSVLVMVNRYLSTDYVAAIGDLEQIRNDVPTLRTVVNVGTQAANYLPFSELYHLGEAVSDETLTTVMASVSPDDMAYLLFTSGSTSYPKAVPMLHGKMIYITYEIGERMGLTPEDRTLIPVSLFWSYGCVNALLATTTHGGTIVLQNRFSAAETLALIEAERCSVLYATPNIGLALLQHPDRKTRDLSSLRTGIGRPASARLIYELGAKEVCTCYGSTESYANATVSERRLPVEERLRSSGIPLPGVEIEIVDPVTRTVLPHNASGEIRLRNYVMPAYYKDPVQTSEAFDSEGWFYTGDLGFLDDSNSLHISGRLKEVIKTGGINVAPAEVEELLRSCPGIAEAVVVGIPDAERTEIVAALLVRRPDASISEEDVINYCRTEAAMYKLPRVIRFVAFDQVPVTDTGKVDKMGVQRLFSAAHR